LAPDLAVSGEAYFLLAKFILLFLLIVASVGTQKDLHILLVSLAMTASYIGYEVTINGRGDVNGGRLEGIGAPSASHSNELASLMVTVLPLIGALLFIGKTWEKIVAALCAGLVLNVILLCNSRGALMAMILAAIILAVCASREQRRRALTALGLGAVALYFLLGDPRILERFWTSFASAEERDQSSAERLVYWSAGMDLVKDRPFGSGGYGFKKVYGGSYLAKHGSMYDQRAVHNGFINEACEWGNQGLVLRLALLLSSSLVLRRALGGWRITNSSRDAFLGICLFAAMAGFLVTCIFGDRLDAEWGYWTAAIMVAYAHVYPPPGRSAMDDSRSQLGHQPADEDLDAELLELAAGN
jgi:O-antigen ligase